MKYKGLIIFFIIIILLIIFITIYLKGYTHKYPKGQVDIIESVEIGGIDQWIMANGYNTDLPVLLWIHGGPGSSQMPVARYYNSNLEKEFIVVHWDQRGAGKSNDKDFDEKTMTVEQFVNDTHELTQYLKEKFNKEQIYLLGHSWGTQIGILTANKYSEDYIAYIGVSQVSDHYNSHIIAYEELRKRIISKNNLRDLDKLYLLKGPPYKNHSDYIPFTKLMNKYNMNMDISMVEFIRVALGSGIYKISDFNKWLNGANRGSGPMWEESQGWEMLEIVPEIQVPVFFIVGENDYNTPLKTLTEYYEFLEAPKGKEIYIIPEAAHLPFFKNPDSFFEILLEIKNKN